MGVILVVSKGRAGSRGGPCHGPRRLVAELVDASVGLLEQAWHGFGCFFTVSAWQRNCIGTRPRRFGIGGSVLDRYLRRLVAVSRSILITFHVLPCLVCVYVFYGNARHVRAVETINLCRTSCQAFKVTADSGCNLILSSHKTLLCMINGTVFEG